MKILVVDDSILFLKFVSTVVKREGYDVWEAEDGRQGLAAFDLFEPDLILTDIQMPNMNGLDLLREIRKKRADAIVVVITAYDSENYVVEALRLGAQNYLRKPFPVEDLTSLLQKYAQVIANRTLEKEIKSMIVERRMKMVVSNRIELVPKIADLLAQEGEDQINPKDRLGITLGLTELLTNAIEHGNLGITFEEKRKAFTQGSQGVIALHQERLDDPDRAARQIMIDCSMDNTGCEWVITDGGEGFDWNNIPNPLEKEELEQPLGRGIFISRFQFDEMEYLEPGNKVRIKKFKRP